MALDPNVILQGRSPEPYDAVGQYGRAVQLGSIIQERQAQSDLRRQQMEEGRIKIQEQRQQMDDEAAARQAYGDPANLDDKGRLDYDKLSSSLRGKVSQKFQDSMEKSILDHRDKLAQMTERDLKNAQTTAQIIGSQAQAIKDLPDDKVLPAYQASRAHMIQEGVMTQDHAPESFNSVQDLRQYLSQAALSSLAADRQVELTLKQKTEQREAAEEQRKQADEKYKALTRPLDLDKLRAEVDTSNLNLAGRTVPNNAADWQDWYQKLTPAVKAKVAPFYSPAAADFAKRLGLTAEQQVQTDVDKQRLKQAQDQAEISGGPSGMAIRATDPTKSPEERQRWKDSMNTLEEYNKRGSANAAAVQNRFDTREFDKWSAKHDDIKEKENEAWKLAGEYGDMLEADPEAVSQGRKFGGKVAAVDPKNPDKAPVDMTVQATRDFYQKQYQAARNKAEGLKKQAEGIRERFQWGEFAPKAATATGGASADAPPPSALKEGVKTTFKNGQSWTLQNGKAVRLDQ